MYKSLMCDEMWDFLDKMTDKETSPDNIYDVFGRFIPPLAKMIGLHMIGIRVNLPNTNFRDRMLMDFVPYNDGTGCGTEVKKEFCTRENGHVLITAMAPDEESRDEFNKLAKLIYSFSSRVITLGMLDRAVITDQLTGAYNTQGMHRFAEKIISEGIVSDYAIFFTNIKNFKYVNQKIGMQKGDEILRSLVNRFKENLSEYGRLFRLGADNFVIIIQKDYVTSLIQLLKTHEVRIESGVTMHVYFKSGIYLAEDGATLNQLMNYATSAYAVAKSGNSGDFVFFESEMIEAEIRTKSIMASFPEALKKREFQIYYQPKIRTDDKELVGCEALCRWIKEDGVIVPPLDFIPVIERLGSIIQLDMYMLEQVCRDMKAWTEQGMKPVRTSVNISRRDLAIPDLADRIKQITDNYGIPHELIEIELTETYGTDEFSMMSRLIKKLKEYDFRISIDDFGSGYATLTMLKNIQADIIKLDRAFIKDITAKSVVDKIILKNVINMVRELNIEVVAEGVESSEQVDFLSEAGCNLIQGFYFDKPMPLEAFNVRLSDHDYYRRLFG